jgi:hypothetical protein
LFQLNTTMFRTSRQIIRMALLLMLFQFLAPAFMPPAVQDFLSDKITVIHPQHSSIVAPLFLKEKEEEEKEDGDFFTVSRSAPLLDFTSHSFNLTASHGNKYSVFPQQHGFPQPPLFTLFCTFLI